MQLVVDRFVVVRPELVPPDGAVAPQGDLEHGRVVQVQPAPRRVAPDIIKQKINIQPAPRRIAPDIEKDQLIILL